MQAITSEQLEIKTLGHLGLVASVINKLGLIEKIDKRLPTSKSNGTMVTMGRRAAAMILNGLGFTNGRLYLHTEFFKNKPISRLLGDGIAPEHLNDDALGRCLDEIYAYGTTTLFSEVAYEVSLEQDLLRKNVHLDTTSFSLYGDYDDDNSLEISNSMEPTELEEVKTPPTITYGYSKNKRFDLKQIILSLTTSGPAGFPIWIEALDGNKSDKESFHATIKKMEAFQTQLSQAPSFLYVADSELYVKNKLLKDTGLRWLTRVPERIKDAKLLCESPKESFTWEELKNGYQAVNLGSTYGGLNQRWQLIFSEQAYHKEIKTFSKRVDKEKSTLTKEVRKLNTKLFSCKIDAGEVFKQTGKNLKYHTLTHEIIPIKKHQGRGKPKANSVAVIVGYKLSIEFSECEEKIAKAKNRLGRFILATNELNEKELPWKNLLKEYKEQSKTESGFKFLKDKTFQLSSVYLKKPERIEAGVCQGSCRLFWFRDK